MRVYETKIVYSLISLGEEVTLTSPAQIADYLRSAFEENPLQKAFYRAYLDRRHHPLGGHLISLGTITVISPGLVHLGEEVLPSPGFVSVQFFRELIRSIVGSNPTDGRLHLCLPRLVYCDPASGERVVFLTAEDSLRPGVIALLYLLRRKSKRSSMYSKKTSSAPSLDQRRHRPHPSVSLP